MSCNCSCEFTLYGDNHKGNKIIENTKFDRRGNLQLTKYEYDLLQFKKYSWSYTCDDTCYQNKICDITNNNLKRIDNKYIIFPNKELKRMNSQYYKLFGIKLKIRLGSNLDLIDGDCLHINVDVSNRGWWLDDKVAMYGKNNNWLSNTNFGDEQLSNVLIGCLKRGESSIADINNNKVYYFKVAGSGGNTRSYTLSYQIINQNDIAKTLAPGFIVLVSAPSALFFTQSTIHLNIYQNNVKYVINVQQIVKVRIFQKLILTMCQAIH